MMFQTTIHPKIISGIVNWVVSHKRSGNDLSKRAEKALQQKNANQEGKMMKAIESGVAVQLKGMQKTLQINVVENNTMDKPLMYFTGDLHLDTIPHCNCSRPSCYTHFQVVSETSTSLYTKLNRLTIVYALATICWDVLSPKLQYNGVNYAPCILMHELTKGWQKFIPGCEDYTCISTRVFEAVNQVLDKDLILKIPHSRFRDLYRYRRKEQKKSKNKITLHQIVYPDDADGSKEHQQVPTEPDNDIETQLNDIQQYLSDLLVGSSTDAPNYRNLCKMLGIQQNVDSAVVFYIATHHICSYFASMYTNYKTHETMVGDNALHDFFFKLPPEIKMLFFASTSTPKDFSFAEMNDLDEAQEATRKKLAKIMLSFYSLFNARCSHASRKVVTPLMRELGVDMRTNRREIRKGKLRYLSLIPSKNWVSDDGSHQQQQQQQLTNPAQLHMLNAGLTGIIETDPLKQQQQVAQQQQKKRKLLEQQMHGGVSLLPPPQPNSGIPGMQQNAFSNPHIKLPAKKRV